MRTVSLLCWPIKTREREVQGGKQKQVMPAVRHIFFFLLFCGGAPDELYAVYISSKHSAVHYPRSHAHQQSTSPLLKDTHTHRQKKSQAKTKH